MVREVQKLNLQSFSAFSAFEFSGGQVTKSEGASV